MVTWRPRSRSALPTRTWSFATWAGAVTRSEGFPDRVSTRPKPGSSILPLPLPCRPSALPETPLDPRRLAIKDLAPGKYALRIDGASVVTGDAEEWKEGVTLTSGPEFDQVEALRAAINRKNELFFHRWRPQNITYLLGFPLIAKPLQINFDSAGRLWIASSLVYPQIKPGAVADDKVLIVEDRDHDGRADSTTVFARGLLIRTGIEPGDGGAYVANSTELLHLKDTDGDGKADRTRVVLSGFGTEDTHHILHTLRWGYDGNALF